MSFGDISCAEVDNYIALCSFRQSGVVLHALPEKFTMTLDARRVDAAITRFDILRYDRGGASQPAVHIVAGILHTVCGDNATRICTRKHTLQLLRDQLESYAAPEPQVSVVRLIVGDDNLSTLGGASAHVSRC